MGDVVQFSLRGGHYAYGRVLLDASVAFYRGTSSEPCRPPIGSRDYQFVVGVHDDVLKSKQCPIVGKDPSRTSEEDWPPLYRMTDPSPMR